MVNILGELNTVERTMDNYISNLKTLVCGFENGGLLTDGKVDTFIKKVLRKEFWVENGERPDTHDSEKKYGVDGRVHDFLVADKYGDKSLTDPRHLSKSIDDGTTLIQRR